AVVHFGDLPQRRQLLRAGTGIAQPPVLHEQREMAAAVLAFAPAVAVAGRGELVWPHGAEFYFRALLDLGAKRIEAAVLDRVFEPRVLAIRPVAPVALDGEDGFGNRDHIAGFAKAEHVGRARIGFQLTMRHAHAAAGGDVP